jgi:hypothetical protein
LQVTVVQQPASTWTWNINAPNTPVQPNPLPLGSTGTLVYQIQVIKGSSGPPTGIFTITGSMYIIPFGRTASITNIYVMLMGPNINQQFSVTDCTPGDKVMRPGSPLFCNINIPTVTLTGQANGNTILFTGYTLQPFATFTTIPANGDSSVSTFLAENGQGTGVPFQLTFPTVGTDCAVLTQTFDGSQTLPVQVTSVVNPQFQQVTIANPVVSRAIGLWQGVGDGVDAGSGAG